MSFAARFPCSLRTSFHLPGVAARVRNLVVNLLKPFDVLGQRAANLFESVDQPLSLFNDRTEFLVNLPRGKGLLAKATNGILGCVVAGRRLRLTGKSFRSRLVREVQHLGDDFFDDVQRDAFSGLGESRQQGVVAELIDDPRNTLGMLVDPIHGLFGENVLAPRRPGHTKAMMDVIHGLRKGESAQVKRPVDSLSKLFQLRLLKRLPKLRLAEDHDLDQLGVLRLQIADHPKLFKTFDGQILSLIDHHDRQPASTVLIDQKPFQKT